MRARLIAVVAVLSLVAFACSNASDDDKADDTTTTSGGGGSAASVDQPGVTDTTIRVGGVVSKTNPINGPYASAFDGVKAYFDMVNAAGGIYGRDLELVAERDDKIAQNQQEVEALLAQDNVFAVAPIATILAFSGADQLQREGVPTFGWNINEDYTGKDHLFGSNYGALCLGCEGSAQPFVAKQLGRKKIGVIAYNVSNSAQCADGIEKSFARYPTADVEFVSKSKAFGDTDFSVEVSQMKDKDVDFVLTCMDTNATVNLAKEMRRQDMDAIQYLPNGYDQELIEANADFMEGYITGVQFAPFETRPKPKGLAEFQKWMKKAGYTQNEVAMHGWISAAQLVEGLRLAGPSFTRQKVVDELNKLTDYTADGLIAPRDWTKEHEITHDIACTAYLKVEDGKLVPTFTEPGKPFMCLPDQPEKLPNKATFQ
jgi:ABC-type branched-subunit amino acid transport system substrate-binding protein